MRWHGRIGPPTRRETSSKATCTVCGDNGLAWCLVGEGGPRTHSRNSVARAYRAARHSALCARDWRTARKGAQCCESAKVNELGNQKSCFAEFVVPRGKERETAQNERTVLQDKLTRRERRPR